MKILIGTTQGLEQAREFITKEFRGQGEITEVGPFACYEDAARWENYMTKRSEKCQQLILPRELTDGYWFGIVLQR